MNGPHRRPTHLSAHALVQLGQRFDLSASRHGFRRLLAEMAWVYHYDAGTVWCGGHQGVLLFPVSRGMEVVTVLDPTQAFINCPQAVFHRLTLVGDLRLAFNLRHKLANKKLPAGPPLCPSYDARADDVWAAFSWADALRPIN